MSEFELKTIEIKAEVSELKEDGTFQGIASVYGIEDLTGDVIDKGAFTKTLKENNPIPILWQHRQDEVIGKGTLKEWQGKLLVSAELDMDDPVAQKAYRKLKKGLLDGLSIGFQTVKATMEEIENGGQMKYIRHITELKLFEVSVVTFPALPAARVTRVKNDPEVDLAKEVADLKQQVSALLAAQAATPAQGDGAASPKTEPQAHSDFTWNLPASLMP